MKFAEGSMGPETAVVSQFVRARVMAGIGLLQDARAIVDRRQGTRIALTKDNSHAGAVYAQFRLMPSRD